jgi:hypothetical protein
MDQLLSFKVIDTFFEEDIDVASKEQLILNKIKML